MKHFGRAVHSVSPNMRDFNPSADGFTAIARRSRLIMDDLRRSLDDSGLLARHFRTSMDDDGPTSWHLDRRSIASARKWSATGVGGLRSAQ